MILYFIRLGVCLVQIVLLSLNTSNYPFIKCFHPKKVKNPHTGDVLTVPCGKCKACLNAKSAHWSKLCDIHEMSYRFCMFVTLTYDNDNIPRIRPERYLNSSGRKAYRFRIVHNGHRFNENHYDFNDFILQNGDPFVQYAKRKHFDDIDYIIRKSNLNGDLPVLCKTDLQLFLKRFRKYLYEYTGKEHFEKVSFFGCGEYGSKHFRPHFHILLYFNDWYTLCGLPQAICKAWKYGIVDYSLSRGRCSGYLSGYVNSFACIPKVFRTKCVAPFQVHSKFFAVKSYQVNKKKIYEEGPEYFIRSMFKIGDKEEFISAWRNLTNTFFPKCRGFAKSDDITLLRLYTVYDAAVKYYGKRSVKELARCIYDDRLQTYFDELLVRDVWHLTRLRFDEDLPAYEDLNNIVSDLYLSKHFIRFVCDGDVSLSNCMFLKIKEFYNYYNYERLKHFYEILEEYHYLPSGLFYDNYVLESDDEVMPSLYDQPLYKQFVLDNELLFNKKIKHKKLNESNLKFLQSYG